LHEVEELADSNRQVGHVRIRAVAVADVADLVMVAVVIGRGGRGPDAQVVLVHDPVAVPIGGLVAGRSTATAAARHLVRVEDVRAVVDLVDDAVEVDVVEIAGIADPVPDEVRLIRVGQVRAVVAMITDAVTVDILLLAAAGLRRLVDALTDVVADRVLRRVPDLRVADAQARVVEQRAVVLAVRNVVALPGRRPDRRRTADPDRRR
jgi:hypothetical protein